MRIPTNRAPIMPPCANSGSGLHQALGTEGRFALAMSMSELAREFAKAGLRNRHPECAEDDLLRELTNELHGRSIGRR